MPNHETPPNEPKIALLDVRQMVRKWAVDSGRRVADLRVERKISRSHLAELTDCTEPTIFRVEQGSQVASDHLRLAIAAALEVEVEVLWPYLRRAEVIAQASGPAA